MKKISMFIAGLVFFLSAQFSQAAIAEIVSLIEYVAVTTNSMTGCVTVVYKGAELTQYSMNRTTSNVCFEVLDTATVNAKETAMTTAIHAEATRQGFTISKIHGYALKSL